MPIPKGIFHRRLTAGGWFGKATTDKGLWNKLAVDSTVLLPAVGGNTAAPTYFSVGTRAASNAGDVAPAWGTHIADDIGISYCLQFALSAFSDVPATLLTANGFTAFAHNTSAYSGIYVKLTAAWARASNSSMSAPTWQGHGNGIVGVTAVYRGCKTTGTPIEAIGGTGNASTGSTSFSLAGVAGATGLERLVVGAIGALTGGAVTVTVDSWACASLVGFVENFDDFGLANGEKMTIATASGDLESGTSYGAITGVFTAPSYAVWSGVNFALIPTGGAAPAASTSVNLLLLGCG